MTFFRNHTLRLLGICTLLVAYAPAMIPAKANLASAEAMSVWLFGFAGENSSEKAWEKISQLNDRQDAPELLLKKASEIISANADLFTLPFNNPEPTDEEVFNVLVQEWNRHQQTGAMGTALIPERQSQGLPFDNTRFSEVSYQLADSVPAGIHLFGLGTVNLVLPQLLPLIGGISINAP